MNPLSIIYEKCIRIILTQQLTLCLLNTYLVLHEVVILAQ